MFYPFFQSYKVVCYDDVPDLVLTLVDVTTLTMAISHHRMIVSYVCVQTTKTNRPSLPATSRYKGNNFLHRWFFYRVCLAISPPHIYRRISNYGKGVWNNETNLASQSFYCACHLVQRHHSTSVIVFLKTVRHIFLLLWVVCTLSRSVFIFKRTGVNSARSSY